MGNRAVICTTNIEPKNSTSIGIYVHWNGGYDSVEAFLAYCKLKGYRPPETDNYGWARLCQVIANYFGGGLSIGIDACCNLDCDNGDNGTYIIKDWEIVGRKYHRGFEQDRYDLTTMLIEIDQTQPEREQFGKEFFLAEEVPISEINIGDEVYFFDNVYYKYEKFKVVGFGEKDYVNGVPTLNRPYVNQYGDETRGYADNCNNYIKGDTVRVAKRKTEAIKVKPRKIKKVM